MNSILSVPAAISSPAGKSRPGAWSPVPSQGRASTPASSTTQGLRASLCRSRAGNLGAPPGFSAGHPLVRSPLSIGASE
jgi:hypothetical protein